MKLEIVTPICPPGFEHLERVKDSKGRVKLAERKDVLRNGDVIEITPEYREWFGANVKALTCDEWIRRATTPMRQYRKGAPANKVIAIEADSRAKVNRTPHYGRVIHGEAGKAAAAAVSPKADAHDGHNKRSEV
jgi:hypothetical protein